MGLCLNLFSSYHYQIEQIRIENFESDSDRIYYSIYFLHRVTSYSFSLYFKNFMMLISTIFIKFLLLFHVKIGCKRVILYSNIILSCWHKINCVIIVFMSYLILIKSHRIRV